VLVERGELIDIDGCEGRRDERAVRGGKLLADPRANARLESLSQGGSSSQITSEGFESEFVRA
jgi:hypothetical protein